MKMTRLVSITVSCSAAIVMLLSIGGAAQQKVPFRGDTPIAPSVIPIRCPISRWSTTPRKARRFEW